MRAVNLLPDDLRGATVAAAPSARPERPRAEGRGVYVVLGALALCVAMLAVYVMADNAVKQRQASLNHVTAQADAAAKTAARLKPYADFDAMARARIETVRGLAAARFDWEQALRDLSRAMPGDVKLQSLNGDMGLPGAGGTGGDPLRGSIKAPAISLGGCAESQPGVARLLSRLRTVDGVTRVSLSKSEKTDSATSDAGSACRGTNPPNFSVVVFFERSAALAAFAPAEQNVASSLPVPSAVDKQAAPTADAATAGSAGNSAGSQAGSAAPPTTSTSGADAP